MKSNIRYCTNILIVGFGAAPLATSLLVAMPFFTGMWEMNYIVLSLTFVAYFSAAALVAVRLTSNRYPDCIEMTYAPVCMPLMLTLAVCALCMVVSKGHIGHNVFVALWVSGAAFFPVNFIMAQNQFYAYVFFVPLIYQTAFLLFFARKERRSGYRPALPGRYKTGFFLLVLVFIVIIGRVLFSAP